MIRSGRNGSLARSTLHFVTPTKRNISNSAFLSAFRASLPRTKSLNRTSCLKLNISKPFSYSLPRFSSTVNPHDRVNTEEEKAAGESVIEPSPETVSLDSSVRQVFHEKETEEPEKDEDMLAGVYSDIVSTSQPERVFVEAGPH